MAKQTQKATSNQRNRIKVGKLQKTAAKLTKAGQKKIKGGLMEEEGIYIYLKAKNAELGRK